MGNLLLIPVIYCIFDGYTHFHAGQKRLHAFLACHNVYHNGFEITSMQGKYFLFTFCVLFLLVAPATASLAKIVPGSPVFIGESDIDISSALGGCHTIAWWQNGTSMDALPAKNVTLFEINAIPEKNYYYNISPDIFTGYTGIWYCEDRKPNAPVFDVRAPRIAIQVWDLDHNQDVTGKTIPLATNITYRIDTNLYPALNHLNRPNANPSDNFFTVRLADPKGRNIANIYTGNYGGKNTLILPFETSPALTSSTYVWKNGGIWDHAARNIQGDLIYPPGTYTFTLSQNLNHMQESFEAAGRTGTEGLTTSSATITFLAAEPIVKPSSEVTVTSPTPEVSIPAPATSVPATVLVTPTKTPLPKKTTYAPLPGWISLFGVGIAGYLVIFRPHC
jgi:hypothetical protein